MFCIWTKPPFKHANFHENNIEIRNSYLYTSFHSHLFTNPRKVIRKFALASKEATHSECRSAMTHNLMGKK